jgi:hypothetical protein
MSGIISYDELLGFIKDMKNYINRPKNSGKVGDLLLLVKKIHKELDKLEH